MTRPFWTRPDRSESPTCETVNSLLSPYVDGVASSDEARRVEGHLPSCATCRQALLWMQETRRVLAGRPVVPPPPDLYARIAQRIAASEAAPPALLPAHVFTLRPAYAAAASLSLVAAVLSYGLLHTPPRPHVEPTHRDQIATAPKTTPSLPMKVVNPKATVKTAPGHALVAQARPGHLEEKVASKAPGDEPETPAPDVAPSAVPPVHETTPILKTEPVNTTPIRVRPRTLLHKQPMSPRAPRAVMASAKIPAKRTEGLTPTVPVPETKHTDPVVASGDVPSVRVPAQGEAPVVTDNMPPTVRTASASSDLMGAVHAYVRQSSLERNLSLVGRTAVRTATVHTADLTDGTEGSKAYQPFVSSP